MKKLSEPQVQDTLKDALASDLPADPQAHDDLEAAWSSFRDAVYNTAKSVLGHPRKKHQDWFNENNQEILSLQAEKTQLTQPGSVTRIALQSTTASRN